MSVPQNQIELPRSGSAWMTLTASTMALMLLCGWALRNQDMLFQQVLGTSQVAITDQSGSESKLAVNTTQQNEAEAGEAGASAEAMAEAMAEASEEGIELVPKQTTVQTLENDGPAALETENSAATNGVSDEKQAETESQAKAGLANDEAEQSIAGQSVPEQTGEKKSTTDVSVAAEDEVAAEDDVAVEDEVAAEDKVDQLATEKLATAQIVTDPPETAETLAEKLAIEKIAVDKALADKLAAEKATNEEAAEAKEKAAEAKAAEAKAAEAKAAEAKAAEAKAAEAKAAEAKAAEAKAAEAKAAEAKAAEAKAAEENVRTAKLAAETEQAEQLAALPNRAIPTVSIIDAPKQEVVIAESAFEKTRREDLAKLPELATQVRFVPNDIQTSADAKQSMDRMFELLFLYSETTVTVQVASNEYEIDDNNQLISRERALVIINYLIERGLDVGRFRIRALGKQGLPFDNHQVTVVATVIDK